MAKLDRQFNIRVSDPEDVAYQRAADEAGISKGVWARAILNAAVGISKLGDQTRRAQRKADGLAHEGAATAEAEKSED